jgi:hypothetical protein
VSFDGRAGAGYQGQSALGDGSTLFGGIGSIGRRQVLFANLPDNASSLQLTFCNGQTVDLYPLNTTSPRFVAALVDLQRSGYPGNQPLDDTGRPVGAGLVPHAHSGPCRAHTSKASRR